MLRGAQMARFALRDLRLRRFGVVAERDAGSISERMGEGFQQEVVLQGGDLQFYRLLDSARGWGQLQQEVGVDTLAGVQAVYLPVSGSRAATLIEQALTSLDRAGVDVRVLGNSEWHDLRNKRLASRFQAVYNHDFYVSPADAGAQAFEERYRSLFGSVPEAGSTRSRLAFTGYDLTRFLLAQFAAQADRPLPEVLREAPPYQGLGLRIDFQNGNVNQALYVLQYRNGQIELVR
jgi:hypothetical protein